MTRHHDLVTAVDPDETLRFVRVLEQEISHVPTEDAVQWLSYLRLNPFNVLVAIDGDHSIHHFRTDTHLWNGRIAELSESAVRFATLEPWRERTNIDPSHHFTDTWVPREEIEFAVTAHR